MITFNDLFKSSFLEKVSSFSALDMILAMGLALVVGLFIFMVYKKTFNGVMYSQSFGVSLIGMTLVTTLIILAVTSNVVLSLGMVGALSIVRFRTAIKAVSYTHLAGEPADSHSDHDSVCHFHGSADWLAAHIGGVLRCV